MYIRHLIKGDGDFMSLNINSPRCYTADYGIVDEVYRMCRDITRGIDITKYTCVFDSIGITPIVAPRGEIESGKWKEVKKVLIKSKLAIISLHIDYDAYCNADVQEKKNLVLQNIFESLLVISKKAKKDFDYERLVMDILKIVE
jgi:hypothetical protein